VWNATSLNCQCPAIGFVLNTTSKTCTICNTSDSIIISSKLCVNCTLISGTSGPMTGNTACQCTYPFQWYWNTTSLTGSCICNKTYEITTLNGSCYTCKNLTYATGLATNNACVCLTNFLWNSTNLTCYCPTNFTFINNTCVCNTANALINGVCVNCSLIVGTNGGVNASNAGCKCLPTLLWFWDTTTLTGYCICPIAFYIVLSNGSCFSCITPAYATGAFINNTCSCSSNFLWNATNLTCYCPTGYTLNTNNTCTSNTRRLL
jgi:hypothetical protein